MHAWYATQVISLCNTQSIETTSDFIDADHIAVSLALIGTKLATKDVYICTSDIQHSGLINN